jgi:hypothetical protein
MHRQSGILQRVIGSERGTLAPELARYVLTLEFPPADQARYAELADRAQQGTLTAQEQIELDEYLNVNDFLAIVQSKARTSLKNRNPAA